MSARIPFPFHGHREHQTAGNRKDITSCEQAEILKPEGRIRIMRWRLQIDWRGNRRALTLWRLIGTWIDSLRHGRARSVEHAHEIVNLAASAETHSMVL